jgi:hypothetical protein
MGVNLSGAAVPTNIKCSNIRTSFKRIFAAVLIFFETVYSGLAKQRKMIMQNMMVVVLESSDFTRFMSSITIILLFGVLGTAV